MDLQLSELRAARAPRSELELRCEVVTLAPAAAFSGDPNSARFSTNCAPFRSRAEAVPNASEGNWYKGFLCSRPDMPGILASGLLPEPYHRLRLFDELRSDRWLRQGPTGTPSASPSTHSRSRWIGASQGGGVPSPAHGLLLGERLVGGSAQPPGIGTRGGSG